MDRLETAVLRLAVPLTIGAPMPSSVLLVGAGRMGQRHLRGLLATPARVHVVDRNPATRAEITDPAVSVHATVADAFAALPAFDAAILSATAAGRLETFDEVAGRGVPRILLEKPLDQSRERCRRIQALAQAHGTDVRCNFYRRTLAAFHPLVGGGPYTISVNSGAIGLGCGGIHWIDFARFLGGGRPGRLVFGEIEDTPIASGRGPRFRDWGGLGLFAFEDGGRLFLSVRADSSAGTSFSIVGPNCHWVVDQSRDSALVHERPPGSTKPNYLYGQDYATRSVEGLESIDFPALTTRWLHEPDLLPTLDEAMWSHELLFDLLETGHGTHFDIT